MTRSNHPEPHVLAISEEMLIGAAGLIRGGFLVSFPTETVYGLGADATNDKAVANVFAAKERPTFNPLIVHVPSVEAAQDLVVFDPVAKQLAQALWPGPLTLVLPKRPDCQISDLVFAGLETLAIRVPASDTARQFLRHCRRPVAAPSANRSGRLSSTTAAHVASEFYDLDLAILDGGPCIGGLESTVIGGTPDQPTLLRAGGLSIEEIETVIGSVNVVTTGTNDPNAPASPGMLVRHYAPVTSLEINAKTVNPDECWLGFGPNDVPGSPVEELNLSPSSDLVEAAANLFGHLRSLDHARASAIKVAPIPMEGLGRAINDRLLRGASATEA